MDQSLGPTFPPRAIQRGVGPPGVFLALVRGGGVSASSDQGAGSPVAAAGVFSFLAVSLGEVDSGGTSGVHPSTTTLRPRGGPRLMVKARSGRPLILSPGNKS